MPGYKGHLVGGIIAFGLLLFGLIGLVIVPEPSYMVLGEWLLCALAGALFPDIDIKSKGQKIFYWILLFLYIYLFVQRHLMVLGVFSIIGISPMLVKHRGIFHKWWFIIAMPVVLAVIASNYFPCYTGMICCDALFFIVGAFSHLILDFGFQRTFRL